MNNMMKLSHLSVVCVVLFSSLSSLAEIKLSDDGFLSLYGDLRLRWEQDWDSQNPAGVERADRNRFRIRARVGVKVKPTDWLLFNARLRTGDNQSQQSPHITLWQDVGDEGEQDDFNLDRAYAQLKLNETNEIKIGRNGIPIWKPNEFIWDDDVYIDGVSWGAQLTKDENSTLKLNAGFAFLPDGPDHFSLDKKTEMTTIQLVYNIKGEDDGWTFAEALLLLNDDDAVMNRTTDNQDYAISYSNVQYQFTTTDGVPIKLGVDVMVNLHDGPEADMPNARYGFDLYAVMGQLKKQGDWLVGYYFARIEKWAVPRFMAQDDWFRFGSATQTRSSDFFGHEFRLAHQLADNLNVIGRYYIVDTISNREDGSRFRLDLNFSF